MRELRPGLWHWEAPHPEWEESVRRGRLVSSYAIDDGAALLLFDPISPPSEVLALAAGRETAIVLTCPWHDRDSRSLVERFGWPVFSPRPDSQQDLVRKYGVSPPRTRPAAAPTSPGCSPGGRARRTCTRPATG